MAMFFFVLFNVNVVQQLLEDNHYLMIIRALAVQMVKALDWYSLAHGSIPGLGRAMNICISLPS